MSTEWISAWHGSTADFLQLEDRARHLTDTTEFLNDANPESAEKKVLSDGKMKKIGFAPNSNSIFVGDSDGNCSVYKVNGFHHAAAEDVLEELIEASIKIN